MLSGAGDDADGERERARSMACVEEEEMGGV